MGDGLVQAHLGDEVHTDDSENLRLGAETEHDCVGDNCPVCSQISQCENTINTVSSAVSIAAVAAVFAYILMAGTVKITSQKPASTLISLKVQLTE